MKTYFSPPHQTPSIKTRRRGFTLIEILVVIAIIGLLSSIAFVAYAKVKESGDKTKARATAVAIARACEDYHAEYGKFPPIDNNNINYTDSSPFTTGGTDKRRVFIEALTGEDDTYNTRKIKFLTLDTAKRKRGGIIRNNDDKAIEILDPWGNPYKVQFDYKYEGQMTIVIYNGEVVHKSVVVFSDGKDTSDTSDDVKSWK